MTGGFNGSVLSSAEVFTPFTPTGSMTTGRYYHTSTLLNDGRVLIAGGYNGGSVLSAVDLFDPASGVFTPTASLNAARYLHSATLLNDGRVLIAGGSGLNGSNSVLAGAEIYDPATQQFTVTGGSLVAARYGHTATLLNDGRILISGGTTAATF